MISVDTSIFSLVACLLYLLAAGMAARSYVTVREARQAKWHKIAWLAVTATFLLLIIWRLFEFEEFASTRLRESLQAQGSYVDRRSIQSVVAAIILVLVSAAGFVAAYNARHLFAGRRNTIALSALFASAAMLLLILFRLVSFHWLDMLLYGPLKLNWFADLGLTLLVTGCAILYVRVATRVSK